MANDFAGTTITVGDLMQAFAEESGSTETPVEVYDAKTGDRLFITTIYSEDGLICLDVESASA